MLALLLAASSQGAVWQVLEKQFSAISIGIAFCNSTTGWTSFTDGASAPQIVRTVNGGLNWTTVNDSSSVIVPMAFAATKKIEPADPLKVATTGLFTSNVYSSDGDNFAHSFGAPIVSQSLKYQAGRFVVAGTDKVCWSEKGALYTCSSTIPLKNPQTARYVSSPSADVIYVTAGTWPSNPDDPPSAPGLQSLTRNVRVRHSGNGGGARFEAAPSTAAAPATASRRLSEGLGNYTAELWKSTDGGKSWTALLQDESNFYFNEIDCYDESTCVAVGEGYSADGSADPGSRVYVTTDGSTFTLAYQGADMESLMAAKMLSKTEHWAGGTTQSGGLTAPLLALHSTDAGTTYSNEHGLVRGQMITALDFDPATGVGWATTVNALQVSSLLKYA